jgi:hypothetical protein
MSTPKDLLSLHTKRMEELMDKIQRMQDNAYVGEPLESFQRKLIRRLGTTLERLDLSDWDPRGPNRDAFQHLLPIDKHLTKTPWWKKLLGKISTYEDYDDCGSKTIS